MILNPAPAVTLPQDVYSSIDCLIMNESETALLHGGGDVETDPEVLEGIARDFFRLGVQDSVVVTLGGKV